MSGRKYDMEQAAARFYARKQEARQEARQTTEERKGKGTAPRVAPGAQAVAARQERINLEDGLNERVLVPLGAARGRHGKGAGFYCGACHMTFKDSLSWVDHLNSPVHLRHTNTKYKQEVATVQDVRDRLDMLRAARAAAAPAAAHGSFVARVDARRQLDAQTRRDERKAKKQAKREAAPDPYLAQQHAIRALQQ